MGSAQNREKTLNDSNHRRDGVRAWMAISCLSVFAPGLLPAQTPPETFSQYMGACRNSLAFQGIDIPDINCFGGEQFAPPTAAEPHLDDWFGYHKVNDKVDLAFVCRWLGSNSSMMRVPHSSRGV